MRASAPPSGAPVPPIALVGEHGSVRARLSARRVEVTDVVLDRLRSACTSVTTEADHLAEASRDWWPLAMTWALGGEVGGLASAVARPSSADEVAAVLAVANEARVPVTAAAGRSGVCGGSVPLFGGIVLDLCELSGLDDVDDQSLVIDLAAGTFGTPLETLLRTDHDLTLGHWPQSIDLSTVGGWLACRSAGQASTRYGKIEDMVVGLDVALADGRQITTGGAPRAAVGPDLNQLFVGSEGTLGVITGARLRVHPAPASTADGAWAFESFAAGLEACRRALRRGATPAVIRLYDEVESSRNFDTKSVHVLIAYDEGDDELVQATLDVVSEECVERAGAAPLDSALVARWMDHRNDVSALEPLIKRGFVVDTMEIAARWAALPAIYEAAAAVIRAVPGTIVASAHQSHSYTDGACLYFTFAGQVEAADRDRYYRDVWDAGTRTVLSLGGALSHHHGVGVNRARFVREALGPAFDVLVAVKQALDPNGVMNPGKLGLPSPFGEVGYP